MIVGTNSDSTEILYEERLAGAVTEAIDGTPIKVGYVKNWKEKL